MFHGAHIVIYTANADADRAFFRDTLCLRNVDAGDGWLIFALPPAEAAMHPATGPSHELYLTCADVAAVKAALEAKGVSCSGITDEGWGLLSSFTLPGGGQIGFYEPRHTMTF
jgi:catechol 2,3-dioxygenase-like lactoylglutathione lyase family enzyme